MQVTFSNQSTRSARPRPLYLVPILLVAVMAASVVGVFLLLSGSASSLDSLGRLAIGSFLAPSLPATLIAVWGLRHDDIDSLPMEPGERWFVRGAFYTLFCIVLLFLNLVFRH